MGLGYRESLRWFRPLDDPKLRRVLLDYAGAVLEADRIPEVPEVLRTFLIPHQNEPLSRLRQQPKGSYSSLTLRPIFWRWHARIWRPRIFACEDIRSPRPPTQSNCCH